MTNLKKIYYLLDTENKKKYLFASFLMLIGVCAETFGIGLIIPLINLTLNTNDLEKNQILQDIKYYTDAPLIVIPILIFLCFVIKAILLTFNSRISFRFAYNLQARISKNLLEKYLRNGIFNRKGSEIVASIYNECEQLTHLVIIPITVLSSEILIVIALVCLLFIKAFNLLIYSTIIFSVIYYIYLSYISKYLYELGIKREKADLNKILTLEESISNSQELMLYSGVDNAVNKYYKYAIDSAKCNSSNNIISGLPRIFLELIVFFILITYTAYMHFLARVEFDLIASEVVLFSIICFRLLPSINRISNAKSNLTFSNNIIDSIYNEMTANITINQIKFPNINRRGIYIDKLSYSFSDVLIKNIEIQLNKGDVLLVDGKSGSGKSTLLNLLMGFLIPKSGNIYYEGKAINNDVKNYQKFISFVPQEISMLNGTLYQNIVFDYKPLNKNDVHFIQCCSLANIDWMENIFSEILLDNISMGQKQRIGIARALYKNNDILIMDEPTSALDHKNSKEIFESIIKSYKNKIIIFVTHDAEIKKYSTKKLTLDNY